MTGERITFDGLTCYVDGAGPPLLLVHSVNAVASAAEVRPLFERYRASRTVYAPDLPGFGLSDRSERAYTPRLMTDALHAVSAQIRRRSGSGPVDALAVSLGCEFLARAAAEQPDRWARLALVSPTGFSGRKALLGPPGSTRGRPAFHAIVSAPLWADALFRGLTLPAVVRYFLERTWGSRAIDEALWAYDVKTARQPGARHAPLDFLAGNLFSADIQRIYDSLTQPVWTSHGVRGDFTDYQGLARLQGRDNWRHTVFPTGTLPYFELPKEFGAEFDAFLGPAAQRQKQGNPAPAERMAERAPG
jgi:pimeloyl-ACP methyl ester carboxylesterase